MTQRAEFSASLGRCASSPDFIPSFYKNFMSSSEAIRNKFRHTDFKQQNEMLLKSLKLASSAAAGEPEGLAQLKMRAETHNSHYLNVEPGFCYEWLLSLIEAARVFDE